MLNWKKKLSSLVPGEVSVISTLCKLWRRRLWAHVRVEEAERDASHRLPMTTPRF